MNRDHHVLVRLGPDDLLLLREIQAARRYTQADAIRWGLRRLWAQITDEQWRERLAKGLETDVADSPTTTTSKGGGA